MKKDQKVFCIGLNKTGTSSLHMAFLAIGLRSVHYKDDRGNNIQNIVRDNYREGKELLTTIEMYDAYSDWIRIGTSMLFREFDRQYPNSKFILNTRNLQDWIVSREKHARRIPNLKELQKLHPDNPWYNIDKEAWESEYHKHHKAVLDYFKDRAEDLLIFDVTKGDEWVKLCNFLNVEIPDMPFPKTNTAKEFSLTNRVVNKLKRFVKSIFK